MELTLNSNNFKLTDYINIQDKPKRRSQPTMKRYVKKVKHSNTILYFNKWFEKEHDYCLPIKNINKVS